ncbi:MAG: hypothetical protein JWM16_1886 [Verrucomicrobiales bacterium]|nr:hypothetical protein [Verrucomicrobiales bacterium]
MQTTPTTPEPAAAETTRRTTTCTRTKRGHEFPVNSTAPASTNPTIQQSTYPFSHATPVLSHPFASQRQGCASPGKATQAPRENTSASLACKASFLCPMATPQPFARKTLALLRFVARNCALSLIIARNPGTRLGIALSREVARWPSPLNPPRPEVEHLSVASHLCSRVRFVLEQGPTVFGRLPVAKCSSRKAYVGSCRLIKFPRFCSLIPAIAFMCRIDAATSFLVLQPHSHVLTPRRCLLWTSGTSLLF